MKLNYDKDFYKTKENGSVISFITEVKPLNKEYIIYADLDKKEIRYSFSDEIKVFPNINHETFVLIVNINIHKIQLSLQKILEDIKKLENLDF